MLVTIRNIDPTLREVYLAGSCLTIQANATAQINRTWAELDSDRALKALVLAGTVSLTFTKETTDDVALAPDASVPSYPGVSRPDPADVPIFTSVWNLTTNMLNWSDGADWRSAAGAVV